jgi:type I restriction enzyme, S subunit
MEWTAATLGEICDRVGGIIQTGPFGSQLHQSDYSEDGIPVVMPKDIIEGRIVTDSIACVTSEHVERLSRHKLEPGDIVYGRRGDIGRQALIRQRQTGWLCGTGCLRLNLGCSIINPIYLHYYLREPDVIGWITNQAIGATLPNLNTSILRSVPIRFPLLPTQRKIAAVLSAYDDLIENNLRRIKIQEEMAQNLYREWFIKFRFPGHQHARFIDSPLGQIPEGWELKVMSDAITVRPSLPVPKNRNIPFVSMSSLSNNSMLISDIDYRSKASGARFQNGDTLFARITPCLENGKTGFVQFLPTDEAIACGSTEFIVLRSKTVCPEYVYLMARSDLFRDNAIKSMSGATGRQRVREECFDQFLLAQPPDETLERFQESTRPQFKMIDSLNRRNQNLRRTRDLLLPKLISGEVDVSELDITIPEEVAA